MFSTPQLQNHSKHKSSIMSKYYLSRSHCNVTSSCHPTCQEHHNIIDALMVSRATAFCHSRLQTRVARALRQIDPGSTVQIRAAPNVPVFCDCYVKSSSCFGLVQLPRLRAFSPVNSHASELLRFRLTCWWVVDMMMWLTWPWECCPWQSSATRKFFNRTSKFFLLNFSLKTWSNVFSSDFSRKKSGVQFLIQPPPSTWHVTSFCHFFFPVRLVSFLVWHSPLVYQIFAAKNIFCGVIRFLVPRLFRVDSWILISWSRARTQGAISGNTKRQIFHVHANPAPISSIFPAEPWKRDHIRSLYLGVGHGRFLLFSMLPAEIPQNVWHTASQEPICSCDCYFNLLLPNFAVEIINFYCLICVFVCKNPVYMGHTKMIKNEGFEIMISVRRPAFQCMNELWTFHELIVDVSWFFCGMGRFCHVWKGVRCRCSVCEPFGFRLPSNIWN